MITGIYSTYYTMYYDMYYDMYTTSKSGLFSVLSAVSKYTHKMYYNMYNVMYVLFKNCIIRCTITSIHVISPSVLYSHSKTGVRGHAPEEPGPGIRTGRNRHGFPAPLPLYQRDGFPTRPCCFHYLNVV